MARIMKGWETHCADSRLPRTLIPRLRAAGFKVVGVEGYPIVNTTYRPGDFSTSAASKPRVRTKSADGWLADLVTIEQRNSSFFSLNRYFFNAEKGEG
jgi:arsenite methyltransferase